MMNKRSCWIAGVLAGGGVLGFLLAGGLYYYYTYVLPTHVAEVQRLETPPTIMVYSPQAGDTVPADSSLRAEAIVAGRNPVARVEVWLDGSVASTQSPDRQDQVSFPVVMDLQISAGAHMLFWRAVDNRGLIGQSAPILFAGEAAAAQIAPAAAGAPEAPSQGPTGQTGEGQGGEGQPGQGAGGQAQPAGPENAPSAPLPEPHEGTARLLPANPIINLGSLIPVLLSSLPAAPSHLQAGFQPCTVRLIWNDNASNEDGFVVWMQPEGGPRLNIYTTQKNPANGSSMFEFDSPSPGRYSFGVESFNALGSQPSEIAWIDISDGSCGEGIATYLEVEGLGMQGTPGWSDIYCFLSLEGAPHQRIPEGDGVLEMNPMGGLNINESIGGKNRILIRMPADEEVSLAGDCWGNPGPLPVSMGEFKASVPREQWDGRTLQIKTPAYVIDYRIQPFGPTRAEGVFTYLDYSLLRPEQVRLEVKTSGDPLARVDLARSPTVRWTWNGNPGDITGFVIYANGALVGWIPSPEARDSMLLLPSSCGETYEIQVAAQSNQARSPFSNSAFYGQTPCPIVAEVEFRTARSDITDDYSGVAMPGRCDALGVYYRLWAVNTVRREIRVGTTQVPLHYKCKVEYGFIGQLGAETATIIIPIDPLLTELRIGTEFWESDDWGDDRFGVTSAHLPYTYDQWPQVDEDVPLVAGWMDGTANMVVTAHVRGRYYAGP